MNKIASTGELKVELQRLAATCVPGASREVLAASLRGLADRLAAHTGEVDLTSPVEGKATLVIDGPDIDSINYMIPAGGVPQKWVEAYLKKEFGDKAKLTALQSKYPRTTKTLQVNSTKYRLERESGEDLKIEIELSVKKPR